MPQLRTASRSALASNSAGGFFIRRRVASPGALVAKGAVKPLARRVRTHFSNNKENVAPNGAARAKPKRRSPLPNWYPRTPLRDITSIVKVLEKRSQLGEVAARQHIHEDSSEPVDPSTPVHAEHSGPYSQSTQTRETLGVVASGPGSTSVVANNVTSMAERKKQEASSSPSDCSLQMAASKPNDPSPADLEKKLSSSIEQIEKMVRRHMKETPKAAQPSKVVVQRRILMSMR